MANKSLGAAKNAKNDEFYTQFSDIQKEIEAYLEFDPDAFRGKVVYCNCDDPFESNFFKYFVLKFKDLGIKKLITTSYKPSPIAGSEVQLSLNFQEAEILNVNGIKEAGRPKESANRFIITEVGDYNDDGQFNLEDTARQLKENKNNEWVPLKGDSQFPAGDFRSSECVELLKQSDIVVTNPPFSLFVEFVQQLVEHDKKFIIIGNMNAITYKDIFPLIKSDKLWLGNGFHAGNAYFSTPNARGDFASGVYDEKTGLVKFRNVHWFTNMEHGRRHQSLSLMTTDDNRKFNKKLQRKAAYDKYDNYDAIEVPFTDAIPSNYDGLMGVPISFLDKYSPEQFEIVGMCENEDLYKLKTKSYSNQEKKDAYFAKFGKSGQYDLNASGVLIREGRYEKVYQRVLIKHRKASQ